MTKRALSLLLTLVMVLSLCVPAFAAEDGFVAEAPADVIEEAPAAPVEPEAPEAEEPAEEPVVDEPVAEEADAPEIAAIMEEEDLPLLVKLGVVSKEAHWYLDAAVTVADDLMADVEAGVYRQADFKGVTLPADANQWEKYDPDKDLFEPATKDFLDTYAKAVEFLAAVDGLEVEYDVTTTSVMKMADDLTAFLPYALRPWNAGSRSVGRTKELVKDTTTSSPNMNSSAVNILLTQWANKSYDFSSTQPKPVLNLIIATSTDVTTDATWKASYKTDYLTALQAAVEACISYPTNPTYAEYKAAATAIIDALNLEAAASRPDASDMPALDNAINAAQAVADDDYTTKRVNYVRGVTDLNGLITKGKSLKNQNVGLNGFATKATLYAYNDAVEDLTSAVVKKAETLKVEDWVFDPAGNGTVKMIYSVDKVAKTKEREGDGNTYYIAFKYGDYWFYDPAGVSGNYSSETDKTQWELKASGFEVTDPTKYPNKWLCTSTKAPNPFGYEADGVTKKTAWKSGDVIQVYLYGVDEKNAIKSNYFDMATMTLGIKYTGPVIKKAEVVSYPTPTVTTYTTGALMNKQSITGLQGDVNSVGTSDAIDVTLSGDMSASGYSNYRLVVVGSNDKEAARTTSGVTTTHSFVSGAVLDEYLVAGDSVNVQLKVATAASPKDDDYIAQSTVALKVKPLSTWNQVSTINKWLAAAEALVPSDYDDVNIAAQRNDINSVSEAFSVINADISAIRSDLTSATVANSAYSQNKVINTLADMVTVCQYLEQKTADLTTLNTLLGQAEKLLAETDKEYTYDSYYPLRDLFKENPITAKSLQSDVDDYVADLQAAIAAMIKEGAVDKAPLSAAIAKADALVEADYTASSWTSAKPAIDAAVAAGKVVLDNANATQAQVTNAVNAIEAAIATLEKVTPDEPEIPAAPKSGTGWVQNEKTGDIYFYQKGQLKKSFWVGKADGASAWDGNWYYVDADGKLATGMKYLDDLHGGFGWYYLQPTNKNGEIGKMLTGWQWVGGEYGTCYFSAKNGEAGKCTYSTLKGNWTGSGWEK